MNATQLAKFPYDFSDVPDNELQACLFYEYARESRAVIREVQSIRRQNKAAKGKSIRLKFGPRVQSLSQSSILVSLSHCTGFPNSPWHPRSDKHLLLKVLAALPGLYRYEVTFSSPPLSLLHEDNIRRPNFLTAANVSEPGTMTLDKWKQWYQKHHPAFLANEPVKFGFFAVNLKYGHAVLIDEFKGILRTLEGTPRLEWPPPVKQAVKGKPGRKSIEMDSLNALGAMRLHYFCNSFAEAQKRMNREGMWYGRRSTLNTACARALTRFQELFGWLDSEKPIHFTEVRQWGAEK